MVELQAERRIESQRIYDGKILSLRRDRVRLSNGRTTLREIIDHNGAAGIVAFDERGRLLMVRQYRYAMQSELLELPAGKIDPGETPEDCARRELEEETGYRCERLRPLGRIYPAAAYDTEVVHLFLAEGLTVCGQRLDEDEFLSVEPVELDEAVRMALHDELPDSKTQAGVLKVALLRARGLL